MAEFRDLLIAQPVEAHAGELTAIVGPNGAGKTTYFNLISGQIGVSAGRVKLKGQDVTRFNVSRRCKMGLGRAFQLTNLFPALNVLENVRLVMQSRICLLYTSDAADE